MIAVRGRLPLVMWPFLALVFGGLAAETARRRDLDDLATAA